MPEIKGLDASRVMAMIRAVRLARPGGWPGVVAWTLWVLVVVAGMVIPWLDRLLREAGIPDRDRQQQRPSPGQGRLRRPVVAATLPAHGRLRAVQAGEPVVHLRAAAPPAAAGAGTIAVAVHPGGVTTGLQRHMPLRMRVVSDLLMVALGQPSAAMGALATLRAATDPGVRGGQYYGADGRFGFRGHPVMLRSSARSHDADVQRGLWERSEQLTGVTYRLPAPTAQRAKGLRQWATRPEEGRRVGS